MAINSKVQLLPLVQSCAGLTADYRHDIVAVCVMPGRVCICIFILVCMEHIIVICNVCIHICIWCASLWDNTKGFPVVADSWEHVQAKHF